MALLGNPFIANVPKQLSNDELAQALRVDIAGEYEAIVGYEAHAMATNNEIAKKILYHIADEERQHVGELQQLLSLSLIHISEPTRLGMISYAVFCLKKKKKKKHTT